ncbi:hypothetical protein M3Y99_00142600 [Aphelenchoides fujianensis]|nr:hypothetical protein M3Y99_00142600 [Aphelenchoides fujianensis]
MVMIESYDGDSSISGHSDVYTRCFCCTVNTRRAPLFISIAGMAISTAFAVIYSLNHEFVFLFPLLTLFGCHFCLLLGNRLRRAKLYAPIVYSTKFLITMLVTGMLFYIYVVVGDARRRLSPPEAKRPAEMVDVWTAFRAELPRVLVAVGLLLFAVAHYAVLRIVQLDDENLQYERFQQRTTTIYSLVSECQSRAEEANGGAKAIRHSAHVFNGAPYLSTIVSSASASSASSSASNQPLMMKEVV